MALIDDVKVSLRVVSEMTDVEVQGLIDAATQDMRRVGVRGELLDAEKPNPLAKCAVLMFCKANYGFDNNDSDRCWQRYHWAVNALMNSSANECAENVTKAFDTQADDPPEGDASDPSGGDSP